jgi:hypothetical protein
MIHSKQWRVEILIDERDQQTHAEARLHTGDKTQLHGRGTARLNPKDKNIPEIGDELAVARALSELSHALLHAAAEDIEAVTHEPTHLDSAGGW